MIGLERGVADDYEHHTQRAVSRASYPKKQQIHIRQEIRCGSYLKDL